MFLFFVGLFNLLIFFWLFKFFWVLIIDLYGEKNFWLLINYVGLVIVLLLVKIENGMLFVFVFVLFNICLVMVDLILGKVFIVNFWGDNFFKVSLF